jgi:nucleotide-binding universal stress UspA family protein
MRIVLGTDGSEGARWAGEMILAMPFRPPVHVTAIAAVDVPEPPFTSLTPAARRAYSDALATMRREAEEVALKALEAAEATLAGRVTDLATRVMRAPAAPSLMEMAEALRADLLVVGSRGLGPVKELLLGSVSQRVVRYAPCSVLIVRGPAERMRRILIGVDGSVHAEAATHFVAGLAPAAETEICLCAVAEEPVFGPGSVGKSPEALEAAMRTLADVGKATAGRVLDNGRALLAATGCTVTSSLRAGHPVDHLLAAIREFRPDLAVIGAKGRTTPQRSALGGVAQMVLKYASCSVLVVRP